MIIKKIFLFFLFLVTCFFIYFIEPFLNQYLYVIFGIILLLLFFLFYNFYKKKNFDFKKKIIFIILLGIFIRLFFIVQVPYYTYQNDLDTYDKDAHLGYIYTIYKTNHLPTTNSVEFYHPPLFHFLGAMTLKVTSFYEKDMDRHFESLQYLTFILSIITFIFIYKILDIVKMNEKYKILVLLLYAFFPQSIMMAGFINNDSLMIMNFFISLYFLIKWYDDSSIKNIILLGLFVGFCVCSKMNGVLIAVPCIYLFLKKMISDRSIKKYIYQYFIFGMISIPLGLWYPIRNYLLFHQSFFYVLNEGLDLVYVGKYSIIQRFLSFSFNQYIHIFAQPYSGDYNIWAYLIKTSLFGEAIFSGSFIQVFLFFVHTVLIILFFIFILKYLFSKEKNNIINTIMITIIFIFIAYISFNLKSPYACSMHFRYIYPTFVLGILVGSYQMSILSNPLLYKIIRNVTFIYILLSILFIVI